MQLLKYCEIEASIRKATSHQKWHWKDWIKYQSVHLSIQPCLCVRVRVRLLRWCLGRIVAVARWWGRRAGQAGAKELEMMLLASDASPSNPTKLPINCRAHQL
jgi:hypothetical protein